MGTRRKKSDDFFVVYADEYDYLTDAARREVYHGREVASLIEKFKPDTVLDAGCASGLTSSLFAQNGIGTTGIDRSLPMVREARKKYGQRGWPLEFKTAQFERLPKYMAGKFDLIVCLANSISGVETAIGLKQALKSFHRVLRPGGRLILQLLNYTSISEGIIFPIRATRHENIVYQRFYERQGRRYNLYLTRLNLDQPEDSLEIFRVVFDNFAPEEILKAVKLAGFEGIRRYSDLHLRKKFNSTSRDLVIAAGKAD